MNTLDRNAAWEILTEFTQSESLRKHALAVEACMRACSRKYGDGSADAENLWGTVGLIHDFDYERFPNDAHSPTEEHPAEGVRVLRGRGYPEDVLQAILGHATYCGVARETQMAKTLFAVDELTGLITASALVRPSKSVLDLDGRSVRKKMKDKGFARGVSREDVIQGASELGVDLDEHIQFVIEAIRPVADAVGLKGSPLAG